MKDGKHEGGEVIALTANTPSIPSSPLSVKKCAGLSVFESVFIPVCCMHA